MTDSRTIAWALPTNLGQSLIMVLATLLGGALPISPSPLLWVNLVTALLLGLMLVGARAWFHCKRGDKGMSRAQAPSTVVNVVTLRRQEGGLAHG